MSQTTLIHGLNPFTISRIEVRPFRRIRKHPMYFRLARKRWGWFASKPDFFDDWVMPACVEFCGSNGSVLLRITCRSNARAHKLQRECKQQLAEFVANTCAKDATNV